MKRIFTAPKLAKERQKQILEFSLLIDTFFPEAITIINPHTKYQKLLKTLSKEQQYNVLLLTKSLTKLFQNHRVKHKNNVVEIAEEDFLTAFAILGNTIKPESFLTATERANYIQLQLSFSPEIPFTSKEVQKALQCGKTVANRLLKVFQYYGLVQCLTNVTNRKFTYGLVSKKQEVINVKEQHDIPKTEVKTIDIFKGFDDFKDNDRLEYGYKKEVFDNLQKRRKY